MILTSKDFLLYENLKISPAIKVDKKWVLNISYDNRKLQVLSPRIKMHGNTLSLKIQNKKEFVIFIESIELAIKRYLVENSMSLFKKTFSGIEIDDAMVRSWNVDDNGIYYLNTTLDTNIVYYDTFNNVINSSEIGENVSAVINVDSIEFDKVSFSIKYNILRVKQSKINTPNTFLFPVVAPETVAILDPEIQESSENRDFFD